MTEDLENLYNAEDFGAFVGVNPKTIYLWSAQGLIDHQTGPRGRYLFTESTIRKIVGPDTILDPTARPPFTPKEAATLIGVEIHTLLLWAKSGRIANFITPANQRRFPEVAVRKIVGANSALDPTTGPPYKPSQLAKLTGHHADAIRERIKNGEIPFFTTPGGHLRIPRDWAQHNLLNR